VVQRRSKAIGGESSRQSVFPRLFEADLDGKATSAGAGRGWIDGGGRSLGQVAHVAFDVQGEHLEVHREADPCAATTRSLANPWHRFNSEFVASMPDLILCCSLNSGVACSARR
jgi:predicted RNA methylase